jgi:purine-binding chemotaxis protein CheW
VIAGYLTFRLDEQTFALGLDEVREIVRLDGLEPLPGTSPPMAGVIVVRGNPLPVLDVRTAGASDAGDVLVIGVDDDQVGVAVDEVLAVLSADDLPAAAEPPARSLPPYVVGVRHSGNGPVLLVDVHRLLDVCAAGWTESLSSSEIAFTSH